MHETLGNRVTVAPDGQGRPFHDLQSPFSVKAVQWQSVLGHQAPDVREVVARDQPRKAIAELQAIGVRRSIRGSLADDPPTVSPNYALVLTMVPKTRSATVLPEVANMVL